MSSLLANPVLSPTSIPKMKMDRDAYGAELMAVYRGANHTLEIAERDDHYIDASNWPSRYFSDYSTWNKREKQAMGLVRGRVLDIGCGAGRYGLYLQKKGFEVIGIDNSPGAVKVCKLRGFKNARVMSISEIHRFATDSFDTIIMMGNNFGLFGGFKRARRLLKQMHRIASANGQIIAEAVDPYKTRDPVHTSYHRFNLKRGRMGGQLRIRVRHKQIVGPWFDYLLVSQAEMKKILRGTGWRLAKIIPERQAKVMSAKEGRYTAIITKTPVAKPRAAPR